MYLINGNIIMKQQRIKITVSHLRKGWLVKRKQNKLEIQDTDTVKGGLHNKNCCD